MPSYLFAVASGDIASASIGPRSTVWTGPDELKAAQWELEDDTEEYIKIAENLVYSYAWGTYNVLVLPPSFPYGGYVVEICHDADLTIHMSLNIDPHTAWRTPYTHLPLRRLSRAIDRTST